MERCTKEKEIAELLTKMKEIYPVIMGNGKDGLKVSVAKIADRLEDMKQHNAEDLQIRKELKTAVHGLLIFQREVETEREIKKEIRENRSVSKRWLIALVCTNCIALIGILISILI